MSAFAVLTALLLFGQGRAQASVGVSFSIADASPLSTPEGNAGTHSVSFPVTLSTTPATNATISFATMYGSATAGSDYVYQESSLTFLAGASGGALTQNVVVTVNGDTTPEPDENFFVQLYNPTGATLGNRFGQAVIANDDSTAPVLSVSGSPNPVTEGNSGTTPVTFSVVLSATPTADVTLKYATNYGTATPNVDYVYKEGSLTFASGATGAALTQTVVVLVNGDTTAEANETFFLQLYDIGGATAPDPFGQVVIQNDDVAVPTISIGNDTSAESDGTVVLLVTLDIGHPSGPVTVKYATMPGTYFDTNATPGADFTPVSGTLTFPAGSAGGSITQTVTVPIAADGLPEPSEHFYVQIYDPLGGNLAAQRYGKGTISAPPVANPDTFTVVGNTKLAVGVTVTGEPARSVTGSVTANDTDPESGPADPLTTTAGATSANGGSVAMNADGSFTYVPAANFVGASDSFTYALSDGAGNTVNGTVTLNFSGRVWYVNNALATNGDGRSTNPFNSLGPLTTGGAADLVDGSGDVLFVYQGSGSYGGGIVLEANQKLIGQPQGLVVGADTLLAAGGSNPTITNLGSGGSGITLDQGNVVRRVNVADTSGAGISGIGISTADIGPNSTVTNTGGAGFALSGAATGTITFDASISENGSSGRPLAIANRTGGAVNVGGAITGNNTGIQLDTNVASFTLTDLVTMSTGANTAFQIQGAGTANVSVVPTSGTNSFATTTGTTVDINNGGAGNVTIDATITQNGSSATARAVSVQNHTGGTVAFPKNVTSTSGAGVLLNGNLGSTINFTGGTMALSTAANPAFTATGGGTVNVTGANNTLTTTTGTALNVANTTIGSSNLTFKSIASNGAANGILLNLTGSSGGLTVTGTGSAGTGGTIQSSTNSGVQATSTTNLNLSWMNILNNGNALNEGGLRLVNVFGTGQLTSSTVTGSFEDNVYLSNTSGTLTSFAIQGPSCSIGNNNTTSGNTGISVLATLTSTMTTTINNCAFSGNRSDTIHTDTADSSSLNATITNNVITAGTGGANQGNIGIDVSSALTSTLTYDVENNKIGTDGVTNAPLLNHGINLFAGNNSTITGKALNNTIKMAGAGFSGTGIRVFQSDSGVINARISGNTVSNVGFDFGIDATDNGSGLGASTGKLNIAVANNNVSVLSSAINAIRVRGRRDTTTCASITGNTATTNGGGNGLSLSQATQTSPPLPASVYKLEIVPPPSPGALTDAQVQTEAGSLNPAAVGVEAFSSSGSGITGVAVGACTSIPS